MGQIKSLPEISTEDVEKDVRQLLIERNLTVSTAESCTGGAIAGLITSAPGSSRYFTGGIVAYSNEVKTSLLEVSETTLKKCGAVSEDTVIEMVKGSMKTLKTDCAVATSGIAGPSGGLPGKPVGTVWIAAGYGQSIMTYKQEGDQGRSINIEKAVHNSLLLLLKLLK